MLSKLKKTKSIFIFDFDGVLVDSVKIKSNTFAEIYKPYGKLIVDKVLRHNQINGGMSRFEKFTYYHKNFLNIILNDQEIEDLNQKFSLSVKSQVIKSPEIIGAEKYLFQLKNSKKLYINSATPEEELIEIVKARGWYNLFEKILGAPNSKIKNLETIINSENKPLSEFVFFGDAINDFLAANNVGIDFVQLKTSSKSLIGDPIFAINDFS